MMHDDLNFDNLRNLAIGTIEFVSPAEWKVVLDIDAPKNTAINTGVPTLFPKVNGFVLIPNEAGALIGIISWIRIEHSKYPIRQGSKDYDLIDLPFPQRVMSVNPLGVLKRSPTGYKIERGIYSYPSVGDIVVLPFQEELQAIVENKEENAQIQIGESPVAANAPVFVNPDKLFGRHLAVLGNTGSGKSCSVAGLIRWSIEAAKKARNNENCEDSNLNARFIILDPNGEYSETFVDLGNSVRKFSVKFDEKSDEFKQLRVPAWMWNSYEWSAITHASGKTQRPLLRRALRELRSGSAEGIDEDRLVLRRYLSSTLVSIRLIIMNGPASYSQFPGKQNTGEFINTFNEDLQNFQSSFTDGEIKEKIDRLQSIADGISTERKPNPKGYYPAFIRNDLMAIMEGIESLSDCIGNLGIYDGPDEDSPVPFSGEDLPNHLERLSQEQNVQQYIDFLVMRIRTMLTDSRMAIIIGTDDPISLVEWLEQYIGSNNSDNGEIALIDLSLVPTDVIHLVIAVVSRIIFEAIQRYRRRNQKVLPTVMVLEEAHTFIRKYNIGSDEISPEKMCCQTFERIAREGRKFGLGLLLSSQRPSELSPTVLSQCNTFLLHRLVNDRDQELVKKLVPDNLGSLLSELPVLPTRKAILLGWASPIPMLIEMNYLELEHRPRSSDPDFWAVWIGEEKRPIDWDPIVKDWQRDWTKVKTENEGEEFPGDGNKPSETYPPP